MNRYRISWEPDAINAIAELWLAADDRRAITELCNSIDETLVVSPALQGEPLHEGLRKLELEMFSIVFSVEENRQLVRVEGISRH